MKMISLFSLISLLTTSTLFAGSIEVAQWMPWKFLQRELKNFPLKMSMARPSINLDLGELKPVLKGLEASFAGNIEGLLINANGIQGESHSLQGELFLEELLVDQVITREFNGNRIRIHVKASCLPIRISFSKFGLRVDSQFKEEDSHWKPSLTSLSLSFDPANWSLTPVKCEGISGVDHQITEQVKVALSNPEMIELLIKDKLALELDLFWKMAWSSVLKTSGGQLSVTSMDRPSDKGVIVYAELPLHTKRVERIKKIHINALSDSVPQLLLSHNGFNALLEDRILQIAPQKYNLQKIKAFHKLTKSRLLQFLVWPDLRRFSGSTPFLLSTDIRSSQIKLKPKANGFLTLEASVNGVLEVEMNQAKIDYLLMNMGLETDIKVDVLNGKLKIVTGSVNLGFRWSFNLLYELLYRPKNRIATDVMKSSLKSFFTNQRIEEELPLLQLNDRTWKLQNLTHHNELISMDWLEEGV